MTNFLQTFGKNRTLFLTLIILALLFLLAVQGMSTRDWVVTVLRGLAVGSITFLVAAGLSIILGLMDVLNLAHGTLFMIGAYVGWSMYVRPDTMVDLTTPFVLVLAGFVLMPLWGPLLARRPAWAAPRRASGRGWRCCWRLGMLALGLTRAPVAIWSGSDYQNSPIVWTQYAEAGTTAQYVQPAAFEPGQSPLLDLGRDPAGQRVWRAWPSPGLIQSRRGAEAAGAAARWLVRCSASRCWPRRPVLFSLVNTPLTDFLFGLSTNVLFVIAIAVAALVGVGLGSLMEATLIRPLYARAIYQIMLTFGLAFIGTEMVRAIWGRTGFTMPKPALFASTGEGCPASSIAGWLQYHCTTIVVDIGGQRALIRTYNEIFVILVGLVVLIAVWLLLQRSRLGMIIRAGVQDSAMVEALGINVRRIFTLVFGLGVGWPRWAVSSLRRPAACPTPWAPPCCWAR